MLKLKLSLLTLLLATSPLPAGDDDEDDEDRVSRSEVQFSGCTEYVGTGPIPMARAIGRVPRSFQILAGAGNTASLVVRAAQCEGVKVDNERPEPGSLTQIGITIVSPNGSGDINNYTVAYVTDSRRLAQRLQRFGLPAYVDEDLVYETAPNPPGARGELFVDSSPSAGPAFFLSGAVSDTAFLTVPFVANWWYESRKGRLLMATAIPTIAFGQAGVTVYTRQDSPLGELIGGNKFSNFSGFNVRGRFATGRMSVSRQ